MKREIMHKILPLVSIPAHISSIHDIIYENDQQDATV